MGAAWAGAGTGEAQGAALGGSGDGNWATLLSRPENGNGHATYYLYCERVSRGTFALYERVCMYFFFNMFMCSFLIYLNRILRPNYCASLSDF